MTISRKYKILDKSTVDEKRYSIAENTVHTGLNTMKWFHLSTTQQFSTWHTVLLTLYKHRNNLLTAYNPLWLMSLSWFCPLQQFSNSVKQKKKNGQQWNHFMVFSPVTTGRWTMATWLSQELPSITLNSMTCVSARWMLWDLPEVNIPGFIEQSSQHNPCYTMFRISKVSYYYWIARYFWHRYKESYDIIHYHISVYR